MGVHLRSSGESAGIRMNAHELLREQLTKDVDAWLAKGNEPQYLPAYGCISGWGGEHEGKKRSTSGGGQAALSAEQIASIYAGDDEGLSYRAIGRLTGLSFASARKYILLRREE